MKLRLHRLAIAEIDREVDYYESHQEGLGAELEDALEDLFAMIHRFPEVAPPVEAARRSTRRGARALPVHAPIPDCG